MKPSLTQGRLFFFYNRMKRALFVGLATLDIQYHVDEFPKGNIKAKSAPPNLFVGGPATNAAVAFAALNEHVNLLTGIGQNSFRNIFTTDFDSCKLSFNDLLEDQQAPPVLATVITASNGERNIFTHNPLDISTEIDEKELFDTINPEILMIDGFYPETAIKICMEAKQRQIPVVFDGGSWKPHLPELLALVDYAVCSNNFLPPLCNNTDDVFHFLSEFNIPHKTITRGCQSILNQTYSEMHEIVVPVVNVVDTSGAGDFFHGAFCFYLLEHGNFLTAVEQAAHFASKTCTFKGTRSWLNYVG